MRVLPAFFSARACSSHYLTTPLAFLFGRRLSQHHEDESAVNQRQAAAQLSEDEVLARELQQQFLIDDEERMMALASQSPGMLIHAQGDDGLLGMGGGYEHNYPGSAAQPGYNHPQVHRPSEWGARWGGLLGRRARAICMEGDGR